MLLAILGLCSMQVEARHYEVCDSFTGYRDCMDCCKRHGMRMTKLMPIRRTPIEDHCECVDINSYPLSDQVESLIDG